MSTEVENQVVEMKFNNSAFEQGVAKTLGTLDALKSKLNFTGATKGLKEIQHAGNDFNLTNVSKSLDALTQKFSTMNIVGVSALVNITNKAVDAGLRLVKSFTFSPIADGFKQYEQQINATQTILANTASTGGTLKSVTKTLSVLNDYANKTIYNFSDMASNLGTFTSAGIKLGPASEAIQGLSNVAAAAGAGTQQAAGAMYQLSQALGRGKLTAQDWNSVVAAGMASSNFKTAILETAKAMGTLKMPKTQSIEEWTKAGGSFQDAMSKGQLTSGVLIQTLQAMTGNMTDAQLAAKGYTKEQIKSIQAMAKQAASAATNVKTVKALIDNLQQGVGSAYAQVFKTLMGDLPTATKNLTALSGVLNHIFVDPVNNLNDMLKLSKHWGADVNLYKSIKNIFQALANVIKPIKEAFREIFPPITGRKLASLAIKLRKFTEGLIISKDTMENIKKTFKGVFTVLKIGIGIVGGVIKGVFNLIQVAGQLVPGILALTGVAGQFVTTLAKWLVFKNPINKLFSGLNAARTHVLMPLAHFVSLVAEALATLFSGDYKGFTKQLGEAFGTVGDIVNAVRDVVVDRIQSMLGTLSDIGNFFTTIGQKTASSSSSFIQSLGKMAAKMGEFLGSFTASAGKNIISTVNKLAEAIGNVIHNISFGSLDLSFGGFSSGASDSVKSLSKLEAVGTALKNVWDGVVKAFSKMADIVGPTVSTIGSIFQTILEKLKVFISGLDFQDAIALLNTGFLIALYHSFNGFLKNTSKTIGKLGNLFDSASKTVDTLQKSLKTMQQNVRSKIILRIGIAVGILAAAVYVLANIDPAKLATAVGALTALFVQLVAAMAIMNKLNLFNQAGILKTSASLVLLATAVGILAIALKLLSTMSWSEILRGLGALGGIILGLSVIVRVMNGTKGIFAASAGLLVLSGALLALSVVLLIYNRFDYGTLTKGLALIAITLAAIGTALRTMPVGMPAIAFGLVVLSGALVILAGVLKVLGGMPLKSIAKSLIALGGALAILVIAVLALEEGAPGAATLLLVAVALRVMTPALVKLSKLSLWGIVKMLVALTAVFVLIAAASILLVEAVPFIAAFGAAILILGAGLFLAGTGLFLFAAALKVMAAVGTAVIASFLQLLPLFIQQLGLALIAFAKVVVTAAPKLGEAFAAVILAIIDAINKTSSKVLDTIANLIGKLLDKIVELSPKFVKAGFQILLDFLQGIDNNISEITSRGVSIIAKLIKSIGEQAALLVGAAFSTMLAFINALTEAIDYYAPELQKAGAKLALAIVDGFTFGLASKGIDIAKNATDIGGAMIEGLRKKLGIFSPSKEFIKLGEYSGEGLIVGLNSYSQHVNAAAQNLGEGAIESMKSSIQMIHDAVSGDIDMTPVIAPVIDLTEVRKGAAKMSTLLATNPINANVSLDQAKVVSIESEAVRQDQAAAQEQSGAITEVKFEQNNHSPEALSTAEIYRRTNNQLALAKKALGLPVSVPA